MKKIVLVGLTTLSLFANISAPVDEPHKRQFDFFSSAKADECFGGDTCTKGSRPPPDPSLELFNTGGGGNGGDGGGGSVGGSGGGSRGETQHCANTKKSAENFVSECEADAAEVLVSQEQKLCVRKRNIDFGFNISFNAKKVNVQLDGQISQLPFSDCRQIVVDAATAFVKRCEAVATRGVNDACPN